uniref:Zinc finger protein n=1 Tax=Loa loa TaxID=7209 RepID=A0A1I7VZ63_LOALO
MKQADNTATLASYKSPSEMGMKRQSERTTGTVLSEVTLNIGSAQVNGITVHFCYLCGKRPH